jgi:hypothetical protein
LQHDRGHLAQPCPFRRVFGLGDDPLGQVAVREVLLARLACLLTQTQPIVENHAGTPERLSQRGALDGVRIDPEVVTKLHETECIMLVYGWT